MPRKQSPQQPPAPPPGVASEIPEPGSKPPARALTAQKHYAREIVRRVAGMDPLEALARVATGDVVGLKWMTKAQAAGPAGRGRAFRMIPPGARIGAWCELAKYCHPTLKAIDNTTSDGSMAPAVQFVFPSNGREPKAES